MTNTWGNNGNSERLYLEGSKITADGACSHEIERCLLLGRKAKTKLDSMLKIRDITLPTKVCLVKAGEGNGTPLQCSCLENPVDTGAWWASVHGVVQSRAQLKRLSMNACMHALEKEMATHSSVLAWRIPGTAEPGGLPSMELQRVGHD